jgi:predicted Zn-dependent protease
VKSIPGGTWNIYEDLCGPYRDEYFDVIITCSWHHIDNLDKEAPALLRVLKKGGLSSYAFTREGDAEEAIRRAQENAWLIAKNLKEPVVLAVTKTVREVFLPRLEEDPRKVPIEEKLEVTRNYNDIPLQQRAESKEWLMNEIRRSSRVLHYMGSSTQAAQTAASRATVLVSTKGSR